MMSNIFSAVIGLFGLATGVRLPRKHPSLTCFGYTHGNSSKTVVFRDDVIETAMVNGTRSKMVVAYL